MTDTEIVDNLIIGSGPAGIATGMALRRRQAPFEVLDVGYDLDTETEQAVTRLARQEPGAWERREYERLFPPQPISASGVESRLLFDPATGAAKEFISGYANAPKAAA